MSSTLEVLFKGLRYGICFLIVVLGIQLPQTAFAGDSDKVYLEPDCLSTLGAAKKVPAVEGNGISDQTFVEEDKGFVSFERVTVIEKRDNNVTESYVQIRNCRLVKGQTSVD